jgi:hypothetical protein
MNRERQGMYRMSRSRSFPTGVASVAAVLTLAFTLVACKKTETATTTTSTAPATSPATTLETVVPPATTVRITDVQTGKSVGADKKVQAPTDTFATGDTIFASVSTEGSAPSAILRARWAYQNGQTVKEDSRSISPTGPAATEFSIQKPGGWPKGSYTVEVSVDGGAPTSKTFKVQ